MPEMIDGMPPETFTEICGHCGFALYQKEVEAQVEGKFIDHIERRISNCIIYGLCSECRKRVKSALEGGMEAAVKRRREMIKFDRWDQKEIPPFERVGDPEDEMQT